MIVIVDYGLGNLFSIKNMLKKIGYKDVSISSNPEFIDKNATKLIFPGVGAFDNGIYNIESMGLKEVLNKKVISEKKPVLGICLGMQLMTKKSEEGKKEGLGWVNAQCRKFDFSLLREQKKKLKIPHMGWNTVEPVVYDSLFAGFEEEIAFYFVHSYYVECDNKEDVLSWTCQGVDFVSSFRFENIFGVQFHPEKSHRYGMKLLKNFADF